MNVSGECGRKRAGARYPQKQKISTGLMRRQLKLAPRNRPGRHTRGLLAAPH